LAQQVRIATNLQTVTYYLVYLYSLYAHYVLKYWNAKKCSGLIGDLLFLGAIVQKLMGSAITVILVMSMMFAYAPKAFAQDALYSEIPAVSEETFTSADPHNSSDGVGFVLTLSVLPEEEASISPENETPAPLTSEAVATPGIAFSATLSTLSNDQGEDEDGNGSGNGNGNGNGNGSGTKPPVNPGPVESTDPIESKSLEELNQALEDLYKAIQTAPGGYIQRDDSGYENGYLTEDRSTIHFEATLPYATLVDQINLIIALLEMNNLEGGPPISSLTISVEGALPAGFLFENNFLILDDQSLLVRSAELGDGDSSLTRSYQVQLHLSTGVSYIDLWLAANGFHRPLNESFTIELLLIDPPGVSTVPDPDPDPDPDDNSGSGDGSGAGGGNGSGVIGGPENGTTEASLGITANGLANPAEAEGTEDLGANANVSDDHFVQTTIEIPNSLVPLATMIVADDGSVVVVNVGLVTGSLILSGASILALRTRRFGSSELIASAAQTGQIGMALGIVGALLGAVSTILLVLSQYLFSSTFNSNIAWTPVLITIGIIQLTCTLGLYASMKMVKKQTAKPRYLIRY